MNREIKFRGWFQGTNGQEMWVYGYLNKQTSGNWEITNGETSWTVDNVGQYTGLKDKNGQEIYEGDIVNILPIEGEENATVMIGIKNVVWHNEHACFYYSDFVPMNWGGFKSVEIIGSIY